MKEIILLISHITHINKFMIVGDLFALCMNFVTINLLFVNRQKYFKGLPVRY